MFLKISRRLIVKARVTVRANIKQLVGGASEDRVYLFLIQYNRGSDK